MTSRRIFLKNGGLALVSLGFAPEFLARTAAAADGRRKVLITIFQRGAVDGLNMIVPFGERALLQGAAEHRHRPAGLRAGRGGRSRRLLRLPSAAGAARAVLPQRQLAIVHACGSPDATRSHFDAQDYMETATPGVKSTTDGWLNRYLHAREHQAATPFRAVAVAPQLPRSLQGLAPALAIGQIDRFGIRGGQNTEMIQSSFESEYAAAADRVLNTTSRDAFGAIRMLEERGSGALHAGQRRRLPGFTLRSGAEADRAIDQSRSRPRGRVRGIERTGITTRTKAPRPGSSPPVSTTSAAASPRSPAISATACRMSSS